MIFNEDPFNNKFPAFKLNDIVLLDLSNTYIDSSNYDVKSGDIGIVEDYLDVRVSNNKSKIYVPARYAYWVKILRSNEIHLYSKRELKLYKSNQVEPGLGYLYKLERNICLK